jgi:hypothetical protein
LYIRTDKKKDKLKKQEVKERKKWGYERERGNKKADKKKKKKMIQENKSRRVYQI